MNFTFKKKVKTAGRCLLFCCFFILVFTQKSYANDLIGWECLSWGEDVTILKSVTIIDVRDPNDAEVEIAKFNYALTPYINLCYISDNYFINGTRFKAFIYSISAERKNVLYKIDMIPYGNLSDESIKIIVDIFIEKYGDSIFSIEKNQCPNNAKHEMVEYLWKLNLTNVSIVINRACNYKNFLYLETPDGVKAVNPYAISNFSIYYTSQ